MERLIRTAQIVSDQSMEDEVGINNTVEIYMEDEEELETFKLVTSIRGNSMKGMISTQSPLGRAILGKKVGDRVFVAIDEQCGYYIEIKNIKNTDDEGDSIRSY